MMSLLSCPLLISFSKKKIEKAKMPPPGILLHPLSASSLLRPSPSTQYDFYLSTTTRKRRIPQYVSFRCRASSSSSSSFSVTDFDLYDLLGIDNTSDQSQIKAAYRSLQKRCHPDIAGPSGHEMAIILNDVYSILSDPNSRAAYDEEQAKMEEFRGYSGKPLYSRWFGSESEERAVFVDEVKCVGCLKCALLADKTFAIESVYGRARVVAQWADPEDKILDAIEACPVDCISMVQRSNLAALEFLMSKQPRGNARTNVKGMVDVKKFQTKLQQAKDRESIQDPREVAFHTIRSFSNWFYWQSPKGGGHGMSLIHVADKTSPFNTQKLRDAAAAAKQGFWSPTAAPRTRKYETNNDDSEYWTPLSVVPEAPVFDTSDTNTTATKSTNTTTKQNLREFRDYTRIRNNMIRERKDAGWEWSFPVWTATVAAVTVRLQRGETLSYAGVEEHMAGALPLEIVNSSWLQAILAGVTWYIIGIFTVEVVRVITNQQKS